MKTPRFSSFDLKVIAMVTMVIDHTSGSAKLLEPLFGVEACVEISLLMRQIGRIAFPLFVFLLVEGFRHTRSRWKYALRLAAFAFVSEWAHKFWRERSMFEGTLNVMFSLLLIFLMLCAMEKVGLWAKDRWEKRQRTSWLSASEVSLAVQFIVVDFFGAIAWKIPLMYGWKGIACAAVFFIVADPWRKALGGTVALIYRVGKLYWGYLLPMLILPFYSGERDGITLKSGRTLTLKWFFYIFYPAHLLLLGMISNLIKGTI